MRRRTAQHRANHRSEAGMSTIDVLITMALFGLLAAIVVTSMGQYATIRDISSTKDDAVRVMRSVESSYPATGGYPADSAELAASFGRYRFTLSADNQVAYYRRAVESASQPGGFVLCIEHHDGARVIGHTRVESVGKESVRSGRNACPSAPTGYVYG